jgi:hypothetical protein
MVMPGALVDITANMSIVVSRHYGL